MTCALRGYSEEGADFVKVTFTTFSAMPPFALNTRVTSPAYSALTYGWLEALMKPPSIL